MLCGIHDIHMEQSCLFHNLFGARIWLSRHRYKIIQYTVGVFWKKKNKKTLVITSHANKNLCHNVYSRAKNFSDDLSNLIVNWISLVLDCWLDKRNNLIMSPWISPVVSFPWTFCCYSNQRWHSSMAVWLTLSRPPFCDQANTVNNPFIYTQNTLPALLGR